jgi:hypothetical protein
MEVRRLGNELSVRAQARIRRGEARRSLDRRRHVRRMCGVLAFRECPPAVGLARMC